MSRRPALLLAAVLLAAAASARAPAAEPPPTPVKIRADLLVAEGKKNEAVFTGNVRVEQEGYRLTCPRLVVTYGAGRRVEHLVATGGVRLVQGDRTVEAAQARLDNRARVLTLTGAPVMTQGESVVHGERVVVDLAADTMRVETVRAKVKMGELMDLGGGK